MLLWSWLPVVTAASIASTSQLAYDAGVHTTMRSTLVDALSADPDYSHLLKLLQRAKLIPTLNRLNGSTLFAPTNDAFNNTPHLAALLDHDDLVDNVQEALRQLLFYHISNTSVPVLFPDEQPLVLKTLHYPREGLQPPTNEPPPGPPWMPVAGGSLGGEPQRLRVFTRTGKSVQDDEEPQQLFVGVDAAGKGGIQVAKGRVDAGNGVLLGIGGVLEPPPSIATVLTQNPELSYFQNLISQFGPITSFLNSTSALTTFLPVNSAWESLHPLEKLYLHSEFAEDDLRSILDMHVTGSKALVKHKHVVYSEEFDPGLNLTTLSDTPLEIIHTPEGVLVGQASLVTPDIYAANGVVHLVSSLLLPPGHSSLRLTPEKFLLALNCTSFVSLLHSVNLTSFIDSSHPDVPRTILAPSDEVLSLFGNEGDLPERGSDELKRMLAYHFLDGLWEPDQVRDGQLVKTLLEEEGLNGGKQVLKVDVSGNTIRFAGAGVVGEKLQLNDNTLLYFISRPINPPAATLPTLLPHLTFSAFLAAIHSLPQLPEVISTAPLTTVLAPRDESFRRLGGLVSTHLLSPEKSSQLDLERVLKHHIVQGVYYSESLSEGGQRTFPTLEGSDLRLARSLQDKASRMSNATLEFTPSGGWNGLRATLAPRNLLTRTGVVHEISDVLLPRSVEIGVEKLVKAAGGTVMLSLISKAGMGWVLNGTAPPSDEWGVPFVKERKGKDKDGDKWHGGWTLLCPTDDAFRGWNLTELEQDKYRLKELVGQHVIPTPSTFTPTDALAANDAVNSRPLQMDEDPTYSTLLSPGSDYGDIVFRSTADPDTPTGYSYIVGIKDARGTARESDWAKVLSWGRSTASIAFSDGSGNGKGSLGVGGVIQLSRVLVPYHPSWWVAWGAPSMVGVLGVALICGFFYCVRLVWMRDVQEATYEPVGGFDRSEDVDDLDS